MKRYSKKPKKQKQIALERIRILFKQAEEEFNNDPELSDRYVQLARKLSMKYKIPIPRELKRKFCRHCYSYLKPPVNCRIRVNKGKVIYYCRNCRKYMRFLHKKKK